nr:immunoglobulin heavy chain junction region [Macaca mulatta]MOY28228.1 immunoglobulin heavy chain junction region [Macaca mulatta]
CAKVTYNSSLYW